MNMKKAYMIETVRYIAECGHALFYRRGCEDLIEHLGGVEQEKLDEILDLLFEKNSSSSPIMVPITVFNALLKVLHLSGYRWSRRRCAHECTPISRSIIP